MEITSQYLEQLRQVIGLRQYGQKDPLSEFKKYVCLFEGLLLKIKNDLIKFLLNLNIVITDEKKVKISEKKLKIIGQKKVGRNEGVHVVLEKIQTLSQMFDLKFLNAFKAFNLASSCFTSGYG